MSQNLASQEYIVTSNFFSVLKKIFSYEENMFVLQLKGMVIKDNDYFAIPLGIFIAFQSCFFINIKILADGKENDTQ